MSRVVLFVASATIACALSIARTAASVERKALEQVVTSDEVPTAFYEHAPHRLAIALAKATALWCKEQPQRGPKNEDPSRTKTAQWLCGKEGHQYLRSVYVTGGRGPHALVCQSNETSRLRFFGSDLVDAMLKDRACMVAEFDGETYKLWPDNTGD